MAISDTTAKRYELQDPDVRLMLRVRDDQADAFEELMVRHQSRVLALLENLIGDRDLAEDLAQESFLRVYRARKTYRPGAKFSTWLYTIVNRVAANALRSRARRREVNMVSDQPGQSGERPLEQLALAASGQMPARQLDRAEMQQIVQAAVASLNERQRMAVLLSKFEQMSYAEISEVMELTPQAIKSLLSRARGNLREVIEPYLRRGQRPGGGD